MAVNSDTQQLLTVLRQLRQDLAHTLASARDILDTTLPSWATVALPKTQGFLEHTRSWTITLEIEQLWSQLQQEITLLAPLGAKALETEIAALRVAVEKEFEQNTELLLRYERAIAVLEKDGSAALEQAWAILDDSVPLSTLTRPAK